MNPTAKANQLKKYLMPGIWEDMDGHHHFSIPELLASVGLPDTPENHEQCKRMVMDVFKRNNPNVEIRYRKSPTDDGEDIR